MAYNSDGYIMIDFTEVDFRRTNQTIDGLFKRCVDVIGTNKFILVINANGRTPLPATCSFTNNQYVIDTCIYMFAISSNDNLFIRRNDVPASDIIDDSSISVDKTWSSNKIDSEIDGKQNTLTPVSPVSINADNEISVDLSGKQDTLTPISPVSINADNEISVDLSGKQDTLTAGDNISIVNNVISASIVKQFNYTGNGSTTNNTINLPADCHVILGITPIDPVSTSSYDYIKLDLPIVRQSSGTVMTRAGAYLVGSVNGVFAPLEVTFTTTTMKLKSYSNAQFNLNNNDSRYTVTYI